MVTIPELYGFPEPPVEPDDFVKNDLIDDDDGCVNRMILASGCITAVTKKRMTILSIREEIDGSIGDDMTLTLKLPAEYWPEDIDFAPGCTYALMLVRIPQA